MSCYLADLFCQVATMGLSASEEVTMHGRQVCIAHHPQRYWYIYWMVGLSECNH